MLHNLNFWMAKVGAEMLTINYVLRLCITRLSCKALIRPVIILHSKPKIDYEKVLVITAPFIGAKKTFLFET